MRITPLLGAGALALALTAGAAWAQAPAEGAAAAGGPVTPAVAPAAAAGGLAGIRSANIFEIAPDAAADPHYAEQTNGERARVQPGNNAPMWRSISAGVTGYSSLPKSEAPEAGNLIQPMVQYPGSRYTNAGEAWRQVRNHWLLPYGGALLLIVLVALVLMFVTRGSIGQSRNDGPRRIERFTPFERSAHWINALAFVLLVISGVTIGFGKFFLQPVLGLQLTGGLTYGLKTLHNFVGPVFAVSLVVVLLTFIADNLPRAGDLAWLKNAGGLLGGHEAPSHRFNLGEKGLFWLGMFVAGLIAVTSGLLLDKLVPGWGETRAQMQIAHMVHLSATVLMMALLFGHIYMGTVGMRGAYKAMQTGWVDDAWAREHHALWYEDVMAGKIPAQRSGQPAQEQAGTRTASA